MKKGYRGTNYYKMEGGILKRKYHQDASPFSVYWFAVNEENLVLPQKVVQFQIEKIPQRIQPDVFLVEVLLSYENLRKERDALLDGRP